MKFNFYSREDELLRAGVLGMLPVTPHWVGSVWYAKSLVDLVGITSRQKTLLLGECKWTKSANGRKVMAELVEQKSREYHLIKGEEDSHTN